MHVPALKEHKTLVYNSSNDGCTIANLRGTLFGAHEDVRHILVLAQKWKVQNDLERFCVGSHHNELRYASVQSLRRYKKTPLLLHVGISIEQLRFTIETGNCKNLQHVLSFIPSLAPFFNCL